MFRAGQLTQMAPYWFPPLVSTAMTVCTAEGNSIPAILASKTMMIVTLAVYGIVSPVAIWRTLSQPTVVLATSPTPAMLIVPGSITLRSDYLNFIRFVANPTESEIRLGVSPHSKVPIEF